MLEARRRRNRSRKGIHRSSGQPMDRSVDAVATATGMPPSLPFSISLGRPSTFALPVGPAKVSYTLQSHCESQRLAESELGGERITTSPPCFMDSSGFITFVRNKLAQKH